MKFNHLVEPILNGEVYLIGQIEVSDEEYQIIKQIARMIFSYINTASTTIPSNPIMALFMVQVAIRFYSEGNYWDYFEEEMGERISSYKKTYLGRMFMNTIRENHLFIYEPNKRGNMQYVQNILAHGLVANNYMNEYFDFVYSFYDLNLLRQIPETLYDEVENLKEYMLATIKQNKNELSLEDRSNPGAKTYKLLKSTQVVIAFGDTEKVTKILEKHVKMIDDFYYDGILPNDGSRFSKAFIDWSEKLVVDYQVYKHPRKRKVTNRYNQSPYLTIDHKNNRGILVIPKQKFRSIASDKQAYAEVIVGDNRFNKALSLYRAYGVFVSQPLEIPIDDIFSTIKIIIKSETTREYKITGKTYRIFDENLNEINQLKEGKCYLLTSKGTVVTNHQDAIIYQDNRLINWDEYVLDVTDDTVIYIEGIPLSIDGEFQESIQPEPISENYMIVTDKNGKRIEVRNCHPIISFKVDKAFFDGTTISCNNRRYRISKSDYVRMVDLQTDAQSYGIVIRLDQLLDTIDGEYTIVLDEPGKANRLLTHYFLLSDFNYEFIRTTYGLYLFQAKGYLTINCNHQLNPINCTLIEENLYEIDLIRHHEFAELILYLNKHELHIKLPIPILKYKLNEKWLVMRPDYYWYKDLTNQLEIYFPQAKKAEVYLKHHPNKRIKGSKSNEIFRFEIDSLVHDMIESKKPSHLILNYSDGMHEREVELLKVLSRLQINHFQLTMENGKIILSIDYLGEQDANLEIQLTNLRTKQILKQYLQNGVNYLDALNEEDLYLCKFYMVESDSFGWFSRYEHLLTVRNLGVINYNHLKNCRIDIRSAYYLDQRLRLRYRYSILDLEKISENEYVGKLVGVYIDRKRDIRDVKEIPNIRVTFSIVNTGICDLFIELNVNDEDEFKELHYDKKLFMFVTHEDTEKCERREAYGRFETLFMGDVDFEAIIRRVK